jgi:hypothetical protein
VRNFADLRAKGEKMRDEKEFALAPGINIFEQLASHYSRGFFSNAIILPV